MTMTLTMAVFSFHTPGIVLILVLALTQGPNLRAFVQAELGLRHEMDPIAMYDSLMSHQVYPQSDPQTERNCKT